MRRRPAPLLVLAAAGLLAAAPRAPGQAVGRFDVVPVNAADEAYIFTPEGFAREGKPAPAAGEGAARLRVAVRDRETGRPTPCRVNVIGAGGDYHEPEPNRLTPFSLTGAYPRGRGNRPSKAPVRYLGRSFYTTGEFEVAVPAGPVRIEAFRGFETAPKSLATRVEPGETRTLELELARTLPAADLGWYSGDPHLHFDRRGEDDDAVILDLLEAEDIRHGVVLCYNADTASYAGRMEKQETPQAGLGAATIRSRGDYHIISAQEYRSNHYGHLLLPLRERLVLEGETLDPSTWPVYGAVGRETRAGGGYAFYAHGGYAQEIWADLPQGAVDGIELLQFGIYRGIGLEGWYDMLGAGYRFPATGASDYPMCRWLGDCRTYAHCEGKPTLAEWLRAVAAGRSFMTTGPILLLEVGGEKPGGAIRRSGAGPHAVTARVRARCEVAPVTNLQLIVNGAVVEEVAVPPEARRGRWIELERRLEIETSSWIAARAFSRAPSGSPDAEAHTNPVHVYIDGRAPYRQAAADRLLAELEAQIAALERRIFPRQLEALAYFRRSREILLELGRAGGQPAPPETAAPSPSTAAGSAPGAVETLAVDPLADVLKPVPPREPEEALRTFEAAAGFRLELAAAEPLVTSPVAAAFDEDGLLYVAEMRDYPYKPKEGGKPLGRVTVLEDADGDGRFERSDVLAGELLWPSGIAPWDGGVFASAPPDIWYLKDTDGDRRADIRRRVYTGFGTGNQQGMLNNLVRGIDGWIHGATSMEGGEVRPAGDPGSAPIPVRGRDFRFDPRGGAFETLSGTAQFGNAFDDWQNRFVCSESRPALHVVLPQRYLERNPWLAVPEVIHDIAEGGTRVHRTSPVEGWRLVRSSRRVAAGFLPADNPAVSHDLITAAAGVTIYRGDAYPAEVRGNLFVGCAQTNVVHRRKLLPDGVTFKAVRADRETEFVRSSDIWFRPVNFVHAPDGTLLVLDMYREFLESVHIPLDVARRLDLTSGRDRGRLWRLVPPGFARPPPGRLRGAGAADLVAALESPNGWRRDAAGRLLQERQDPAAVEPLRRLLRTSPRSEARLHALWSLHALGALRADDIALGLADAAAGVREHALRLAEPELDRASGILEKVLLLGDDPGVRVAFQAAFSLGETKDPRATPALARILRRHASDPWMRAAVLSSASGRAGRLLAELLADHAFAASEPGASVLAEAAEIAGARNDAGEARGVLEAIGGIDAGAPGADGRRRLALGFGKGLRRAGARLDDAAGPAGAEAFLRDLRARALRAAAERDLEEATRLQAVELLGCFRLDEEARGTLGALLDPHEPQAVALAAVRALATGADAGIALLLLEPWPGYPPAVRAEALQALLSRPVWLGPLLDAIEAERVAAGEIDPGRRAMLVAHAGPALAARAKRLLGAGAPGSRDEAIAAYRGALALAADPARGEKIYERQCMMCHAFGEKGHAVGPSLALTRNRPPDVLLADILDPNREVNPAYVGYVVVDAAGAVHTGILAAETATSVTLKSAEDVRETILRRDIREITSTARSLMPDGMEAAISPREMADLIAFIVVGRYDLGTEPGILEPEK